MRDRLARGESVYGTMLCEAFFPNIVYMYKNSGYDYFIIDCEHGPFDYAQTAALVTAARLAGLCVIVRIPALRREYVVKYLDMGASGLLLPMAGCAGDVKELARLALYPPEGGRGISVSRAHSEYNPGRLEDYFAAANGRVILLAQIETRAALEDVEAIASTDGLNGLVVGPSDLSAELGDTGQSGKAAVYTAMERVKVACGENGLSCGIITSDRPMLGHAKELGYKMLCFDSELRLLSEGLKKGVEEIKRL